MPGIWNINNGYNTNSKKISSKLTFEVGEKFTGRVVGKGDGKDVTIKLSDGWQFIAEVDGNVNFEELKLIKFQVDGFENGKLKLKVINQGTKQDSDIDENFQEIIEKEGLSKEDVPMLKKMVSHSIPLTKDNINEIKGLLQFNQKINLDPDEVNKFIEKYIASKNIELNSEDGQKIKDVLTKFFNEFKDMSEDDIFIFIENNLDFSQENIESFNKLFKGDSSIEKILADIKNKLEGLNIDKDILESIKNNIDSAELGKTNDKASIDTANTSLASKIYSENNPINTKVDVLDLLKTLASNGNEDNVNMSGTVENNINDNNLKELENLDKSLLNKLQDKDFINDIKGIIGNGSSSDQMPKTQASNLIESTNKARLEELLSRTAGKDINLSDSEFKAIKELINKSNNINGTSNYSTSIQKEQTNTADMFNMKNVSTQFSGADKFKEFTNNSSLIINNLNSQESIKEDIKNKINNVKDIVKDLVSQTGLNDSAVVDKVINTLKGNINDFKVFNSISNEYYYLNLNVNAQNAEYPCKLIIKDNRKDGKRIDTTNTKMVVSVKTINLGEIDGYLTLKNNRLDVNLKCDSEFSDVLNIHKTQLSNGLSSIGLLASVTVSSKEKPVDLSSCREFFTDVNISAIDTKV
ncbi:MAG: flagellar hook-length control protein FliK [Clostridium sp.]|nr:flagellar hook-length control protein FliK [Clostridium sp.]